MFGIYDPVKLRRPVGGVVYRDSGSRTGAGLQFLGVVGGCKVAATEDSVHMGRLGIGSDDGIELFDSEGVEVVLYQKVQLQNVTSRAREAYQVPTDKARHRLAGDTPEGCKNLRI